VTRTSNSSDRADRNAILRIQPSRLCASRQRFDVAVTKETLLLVELETQGFCVDLRALSKLVLSDLGATLQVLRLAGREYGDAEGRPVRVEDCIADLGVQACLDVMSAHLMPRDLRSTAVSELWSHSREIAGHSQRLAEQMPDVDPDQAYLVGLCHSIGSLPGVLGLDGTTCQEFDIVRMGLELATEWSLPGCVVSYFSDLERHGGRSAWPGIVQAAHRCAGEPTGECASSGYLPPQLLWAV
jgi:HDOD domain